MPVRTTWSTQNPLIPIKVLGPFILHKFLIKYRVDSNKTASSRLTSSDKLSALPASSPNLNRILRSPGLGQGRAYRRSLDTSSLPSDLESGGGGYGSPYHTWNSRPNGSGPRSNASDGSYGHETPKRVSFDSDRISLPTIQSVRQGTED